MSTTTNHTQYQHDNKKQRNDILKSLSMQDYKAAKERNRNRVPGTCEWFASHQLFRTWKDGASPSMLWVSADPGCGKSVLAKHLVNTVLPTTDMRTTCYFFFKDDFEDQKPARNALSCILHQLLLARKQVFSDEIVERFETSSQSTSSLQYLWDTLVSAASNQHAGEVVCILDAFDECKTEDQEPFAQILRQFYDRNPSKANLKFLITSRPYTSIRRGFLSSNGAQNSIIHLRGDNEEEVAKISKEIDIFIDAEIEHVQRNLSLSLEKKHLLLRAIRRVPHRTYLWVHLTLDWINKEIGLRNSDIRDIALHLPQTVDDAYEKILSRIPDSDRGEAEKLLHIIVAAARPLTLQEIDEAVAVEHHHQSHNELSLRGDHIDKYVRDICGLFVTIIDSRIYLLHQTAKEFLQPKDKGTGAPGDDNQKWKHSLQPQKSEGVLFQICAAYLLLSELKVTMQSEDVNNYVERFPFLEYASTNWALHHRSSSPQDTDMPHSLIYPASKGGTESSMADLLWFRVYWSTKDTQCPVFFTPLMAAAFFGLESSVKLLLKEGKQQIRLVSDPHGRTALSWASENGFDRVVRLIIPHPTQYRLKAKLLLFSDSIVSEQDKEGMTPLHYAALNGYGKIVDLLVKAGAKSNVRDHIGGTALTYGLISQHHDIFQKLQKQASEEDVRNTLTDLLFSAVERDNKSVVRQVLALETSNVAPNSFKLLTTAKSVERSPVTMGIRRYITRRLVGTRKPYRHSLVKERM
ncbi:ankyrin repeat-containing protein [Ophiostoma piceae UAMH 11346]|uniref:Ankyrin repeat-containing protein n=1 Tax=Ophiostoma piceae (strain UAMH 11346) TaxID=1262450 RepID=S3C2F6_OPHP1|nr:ankyrin repeat-containing protein [Ophiostoma piceae UAMH 11346]